VIVGFPGETEEDFKETYRFLQELDISYLHVFTYSERANTPAAEMEGVVPMEVRRDRNRLLNGLSVKKRRAFYEQFVGTIRPVLFEKHKESGLMSGFTDNYVRVVAPRIGEWMNTIREVPLTEITPDGLVRIETEKIEA
jgi:threonylcarbamoyladenosine tRNA methylthiotransferase MtaB